MDEYNVLIKNASVVDGSGRAHYKASIGIKDSKVVAIGQVSGDAATEIDASGLTAVPGFIDSHSHGDMELLFFPKCESYLFQGVTTMVAGQCGMSPAPIGDNISLPGIAGEYLSELEPYKYYPAHTVFPRERVNQIMKEKFGWIVDWRSMDDWFKVVERKKISMNIATLVGHVTVRSTVMEDDFKRPATKAEKTEMGELIRKSLDEGAIGMSMGLDYDPDTFADREELIEHCKIVAEYGAIVVPHSRRTGRRRDITAGFRLPDKIDGILEAIDLCRASKAKMNIAHLFTGWYINPGVYPSTIEEANRRATLAVIDDALKEGLDISFDVLPSSLTSNFGGASYLCSVFEPWLRDKGGRQEFAKALGMMDFRQEIKEAIRAGKWYIRENYNPNTNPRWAENYTVFKHKDPKAVDKTLAKIADERKKDPFDVWFDLIAEDPDALCGQTFVYPSGTPDLNAGYHKIFWEHRAAALGIDTGVDDYKHVYKTPPYQLPMINTYSAFPSFLERFVRKDEIFTIEQAVFKTSTQAAQRHGLEGRGVIAPGAYADIVLLSLDKVKVTAAPTNPRSKPAGIEYVFVNGVPVISNGKHSEATPGHVIRRKLGKK